jgi:hypothetical protein
MRLFRTATAAALAISMAATPLLAQSAAPLSVSRASAVTEDGNQLDRSGYLLPAAVIIAVLAAAILLKHGHSDNLGNPVSP